MHIRSYPNLDCIFKACNSAFCSDEAQRFFDIHFNYGIVLSAISCWLTDFLLSNIDLNRGIYHYVYLLVKLGVMHLIDCHSIDQLATSCLYTLRRWGVAVLLIAGPLILAFIQKSNRQITALYLSLCFLFPFFLVNFLLFLYFK